jgi:cytochrome c oxidase subunit III
VNIFRQLTEKPWLVTDRGIVEAIDESAFVSSAPTGLRVYFAVATVMFSLIAAAYLMRMGVGHPGEGLDWRSTPKPFLLWVNTAILLLSSFTFHRTQLAARRGQMDRVAIGLLTAGFFAFAFLAGQLTVWWQLADAGNFVATNPANSFFYLITTLHGLHLLGGLVAWGRTTAKLWDGVEPATISLGVDLCAIYWHFLLVVWLAFFYLLLST